MDPTASKRTVFAPPLPLDGVVDRRFHWQVEKKNICIYSQLKSCSSSEAAAMTEGLPRHCTDAEIESNYVDTHGASVVGLAFTELLNFRLLPRLKNISSIRLYRPDDSPPGWPALGASLTRPNRREIHGEIHGGLQIVENWWVLELMRAHAARDLAAVVTPFVHSGRVFSPSLPRPCPDPVARSGYRLGPATA
ncbi:Tn3 family transposase [Streptomyces scopuliridis]|uniref:Tn3 family transposase n=1 Tax=Streptomyces scopuliridis TaxID=452529 RepID=UPI0036A91070